MNRGHAANHLAKMHFAEGNTRRAIFYLRWIAISGLLRRESRFYVVRYTLGMYYACDGKPERALAYWRELLDCFPDRRDEVAGFFANAPKLRAKIDSQPGFGEL